MRGQQATQRGCAEVGPCRQLGSYWEADAEGWWFAAIDGEGCVQPSVLAKRGVGAGGLAARERRAHSCQQGRKSRYISVRLKGRGSTFFDVANVL